MIRHWPTRLANGACLTSATLWLLSLIAAFLTPALNPLDHHVTINPDCRLGVSSVFNGSNFPDPVLVCFNHEQGPYRGSLITVDGDPRPPVVTGVDWEFPRIYYRHIHSRRDDSVIWTLMVSLWYPLILFAIGPLVWGVSRWRRSRVKVELSPEPSTENP